MRPMSRWNPSGPRGRLSARGLLVGALLALLALGGACDSDDGDGNGSGNGSDTAGGPGGDTGGGGDEAEIVEVSLVEWNILMPANLEAGRTTFVVTNDGTMPHSFEIEDDGGGFDEALANNLDPGQSAELTVDLPAGSFTAYCPIGGHRELGMEIFLTVTGE